MISQKITECIDEALQKMGLFPPAGIPLQHPEDPAHGDYSSNVALALAKKEGQNPVALAEKIAEHIKKPSEIAKISVATPGFINFFLSENFFSETLIGVLNDKDTYGKNDTMGGKKVMIEYTDPNPFKEFHIGHLMSNTIGESLSRVFEWSGAEVKRANYQGDVGLHVAKALWGWMQMVSRGEIKTDALKNFSLDHRIRALGTFYVAGATAYDKERGTAKTEIEDINRKVYDKSDPAVNEIYELGRAWSLDYFERIYKTLGTAFDFYFFESEAGGFGKEIVEENERKGVFEKSKGAVIFPGEKYGLHTRVFISSVGLPTYEAKELGLASIKYDRYPYDLSFVVTGNEIIDYFKVLLKVMESVFPELAKKTVHIPHGMLRLPSGKMSSRTGSVIPAESLLEEIKKLILTKMNAERMSATKARDHVAQAVAVGAIKYSILRQATGKDIIFDFDTSLSFEGNSGPYLQYTYARTQSVLQKAEDDGIAISPYGELHDTPLVSRLLYRFPEVILRAERERAPHAIATYLFELAQAFNNFYTQGKIVEESETGHYKLAVTDAVGAVLRRGLWLLGIEAPERM